MREGWWTLCSLSEGGVVDFVLLLCCAQTHRGGPLPLVVC